jgi:hypothetical protein
MTIITRIDSTISTYKKLRLSILFYDVFFYVKTMYISIDGNYATTDPANIA